MLSSVLMALLLLLLIPSTFVVVCVVVGCKTGLVAVVTLPSFILLFVAVATIECTLYGLLLSNGSPLFGCLKSIDELTQGYFTKISRFFKGGNLSFKPFG